MILITGTGRAGTTFLIGLYTLLGFKTGFDEADIDNYLERPCKAGLEHFSPSLDVVKGPSLYKFHALGLSPKYVIVPMRDLFDAAESRRMVQRLAGNLGPVDGGLWDTSSLEVGEQEKILLKVVYDLCRNMSEVTAIPIFIAYPRLIKDTKYLYEKIKVTMPNVEFLIFEEAHRKLLEKKKKISR